MPAYCSLIIPFVAVGATQWHPPAKGGSFDPLCRGAFATEAEAHAWARAHIPGSPYRVRVYPAPEKG